MFFILLRLACAGKPAPKKKGKKGNAAKENPPAVWDMRKAKMSTLAAAPFPVVDRVETKALTQKEVLNKVSCLRVYGFSSSFYSWQYLSASN